MPGIGLLLSLPTESVAVRATVGSLAGLALVALLLRSGLRVERVRSVAVLVPIVALVGAVLASWGQLLLPTLMTTTDSENALPVLVRGGYVRFAPIGWPLLVAWLAVAGVRVTLRVRTARRMQLLAATGRACREPRLAALVAGIAAQLRVPEPRVVVAGRCPGGAAVVGMRQPTLVVDAGLLASLDDQELEGLVAHELAHVRRRDNLVAFVVGVIRDLFFFVPSGRWVTRRLYVERELAADQMAIGVTGRPGALASGLLKVIDRHRPSAACATFAAPAATVTRVERLVSELPEVGGGRAIAESAIVAGALTLALAMGIHLPAVVAGAAGERDALAVLWAWQKTAPAPPVEATAFDVFRRSRRERPVAPAAGVRPVGGGEEFSPAYLRGDVPLLRAPSAAAKGHPARAMLDPEAQRLWRAMPVVAADDGVGVYWLQRRAERPPGSDD